MIYTDPDDGSAPGPGYVNQDPDLRPLPSQPPARHYTGADILQFMDDFAMEKVRFIESIQKLHPKMSMQNLDNWISERHAISGRLGEIVESFMNGYARTHSRQSNLFDFVS